MFQIARGSGATLKTLEITKSVKKTVHTELFMRRRQELGKHSTDQESCLHRVVYMAKTKVKQALDRSRKVVNKKITRIVVYMAKTKARQSTRQVK